MENLRTQRKICLSASLSTADPVANAGLRIQRRKTNRLRIILHGSISQKTTLNIKYLVCQTVSSVKICRLLGRIQTSTTHKVEAAIILFH
jgi:hypothetical protein